MERRRGARRGLQVLQVRGLAQTAGDDARDVVIVQPAATASASAQRGCNRDSLIPRLQHPTAFCLPHVQHEKALGLALSANLHSGAPSKPALEAGTRGDCGHHPALRKSRRVALAGIKLTLRSVLDVPHPATSAIPSTNPRQHAGACIAPHPLRMYEGLKVSLVYLHVNEIREVSNLRGNKAGDVE